MEANLVARASIHVRASIESTWHALVDPDAIRQYMFGAQVVSDWQVGSPITWQGEWKGAPYQDKGVILKLENPRLLQYSHFSPLSGQPDEPANYHTVTVELSADGAGTTVVLTQDHNASEDERIHSQQNWEMMLAGLKTFVEAN